MRKPTIARGVLVCAAAAFLAMGSAEAQETDATATGGEVTTPTEGAPVADSTTETGAGSVPTSKIAAEFQDFLGPDAESVVRGLRNGESFSLTETTPGETTPGETPPGETPGQTGTTTEVTIEPATGKMGYGNIRTALQLSQFQLRQAGIEQPTASQLDAALNGGTVTNSEGTATELQGTLALRSEGMGWGRIAQEYGTKVGWVKNGRASLAAPTSGDNGAVDVVDPGSEAGDGIVDAAGNAELNRASVRSHGASKKSGASAVVTGTGAPSGRGRGQGVVTGLGTSSQGHGRGRGIVDATGSSSVSKGHGRGRGIVDATGSSSVSNGNGRGRGIVTGLGGSSHSRGGSHVTTGLGSSSGSQGHGRGHGIVTGLGGSSHGRGGSHVTTGLGESSGSHGRGKSHSNAGGNGKGHGRYK